MLFSEKIKQLRISSGKLQKDLAKAIGVDKVVQDSSGNAGNSVAAYCARAGIACEIFVKNGKAVKSLATGLITVVKNVKKTEQKHFQA